MTASKSPLLIQQEGLFEERQAVLRTRGTKDSQEGMRAFMEKRPPVFTGD